MADRRVRLRSKQSVGSRRLDTSLTQELEQIIDEEASIFDDTKGKKKKRTHRRVKKRWRKNAIPSQPSSSSTSPWSWRNFIDDSTDASLADVSEMAESVSDDDCDYIAMLEKFQTIASAFLETMPETSYTMRHDVDAFLLRVVVEISSGGVSSIARQELLEEWMRLREAGILRPFQAQRV